MTDDDDWEVGLDRRISDYLAARDNDKAPEGTVGLPAVLAALGADVRAAELHAKQEGHATLSLQNASVELDVAMTYDLEADAKVKFWVFTEAAIDVKAERAKSMKVTVNLTPVGDAHVVGLLSVHDRRVEVDR
jgi:Trypsin-co-occurring domain 2